jgi:hypothetical protein
MRKMDPTVCNNEFIAVVSPIEEYLNAILSTSASYCQMFLDLASFT